jgi:hypothetical protein
MKRTFLAAGLALALLTPIATAAPRAQVAAIIHPPVKVSTGPAWHGYTIGTATFFIRGRTVPVTYRLRLWRFQNLKWRVVQDTGDVVMPLPRVGNLTRSTTSLCAPTRVKLAWRVQLTYTAWFPTGAVRRAGFGPTAEARC